MSNSRGPADTDRLEGYGDIGKLREQFMGHFSEFFASGQAPRTQDVADAILGLIEMPAGKRPVRTVCGLDFGAQKFNETVAPIQADVLRALGMGQLIGGIPSVHHGKPGE